jgi:4-hydroxy-tetrahydrodipicolinate reductase
MHKTIRVAILGTGQMGCGIARRVLDAPGVELVAAYGKRPERVGMDVGRAIGLERDLGIAIDANLSAAAERTQPDVAIQATCSTLDDAWPEIAVLLRNGVSIVSIAEEMAYPAYRSPAIASEMQALARANGAAVVGTGINPGFVLDLLVVTLTGVCSAVDAITATRINDLSPYGPAVLSAQGVGLTPDAFEAGLNEGTVTGHVGFPESISMIAAALGCTVERIEQTIEPLVSEVRRETPFVTVEPGCVAGNCHTAVAYRGSEPFITLVHPQQVRPELAGVETGDSIEIAGTPSLRFAGSPEIPGGEGTVAVAVNMIPRILAAAPGLYAITELPVPAALLGDTWRTGEPTAEENLHG